MAFVFLALVSFTWTQIPVSTAKTVRDVTFGSSFKLVNVGNQVRLHSHDVKYGSGSGQQSVTGVEANDDVNSHWMVKGTAAAGYKRGEPIPCGSKIRLEHSATSKNLHSHNFPAPLSNHQEISAFGQNGEGDSGDIWKVICSRSNSKTWKRDESVELKHIDTDIYLGVSGRTFGRPIRGQYEIVGLSTNRQPNVQWLAGEGIFFHPSEVQPRHPHTEL